MGHCRLSVALAVNATAARVTAKRDGWQRITLAPANARHALVRIDACPPCAADIRDGSNPRRSK